MLIAKSSFFNQSIQGRRFQRERSCGKDAVDDSQDVVDVGDSEDAVDNDEAIDNNEAVINTTFTNYEVKVSQKIKKL